MLAFLARILPWALALYIAYVFLWYLQFKFGGHPGSVYLFDILTTWLGAKGHEAVMRIGTGTAELIAAFLLLHPRTQGLGGLMATGIMSGAIFFHLVSPLGIDPYNDGGRLFTEACVVWGAGLIIAFTRRHDLISLWVLMCSARTKSAKKGASA